MSSPESPRPADPPDDALAALGERLRSAQETADRLVREATDAAHRATASEAPEGEPGGSGRRPPPRGFASPGDGGSSGSTAAEIQALAAVLDLGRSLLPPELRAQIAELVREVLLVVRALIDWYLERVEARRDTPVEVQDIPIS